MSNKKYSNRTLEGNWFEDRFTPAQPNLQEDKDVREKEESISWLGSAGVPKPLNTIKRAKKWNTTGVIPNDNFREVTPTTKADLSNPNRIKDSQRPPLHMDRYGRTHKLIPDDKVRSIAELHRASSGPWLGYSFVDPTKPKDTDKRYFETSYATALQSNEFVLKRPQSENEPRQFLTTNQQLFAQGQPAYEQKAGVACKSAFMELSNKNKRNILAAEIMRTGNDPQHNTQIQKTWVPGGDPAVRYKMQHSYVYGLPQNDNELSLPVGVGAFAARAQSQGPTGNRRIRTDVTTAPDLHIAMGFR